MTLSLVQPASNKAKSCHIHQTCDTCCEEYTCEICIMSNHWWGGLYLYLLGDERTQVGRALPVLAGWWANTSLEGFTCTCWVMSKHRWRGIYLYLLGDEQTQVERALPVPFGWWAITGEEGFTCTSSVMSKLPFVDSTRYKRGIDMGDEHNHMRSGLNLYTFLVMSNHGLYPTPDAW